MSTVNQTYIIWARCAMYSRSVKDVYMDGSQHINSDEEVDHGILTVVSAGNEVSPGRDLPCTPNSGPPASQEGKVPPDL